MPNDILQKWRPALDLKKFERGEISGAVWTKFIEFVELCHAVAHYKQASEENRKSMRIIGLSPSDRKEYQLYSEKASGNSMRARFLAAECAFAMLSLSETATDHSLVQGILVRARLSQLGTMRGHETADFQHFALSSFSAATA